MTYFNNWLKNTFIAHRGLYDNIKIPENSLLAFANAVKFNYAMELDVHLTKDDVIVVFHDANLERMTGKKGKIQDFTYNELSQLTLLDTDQHIPTLQQVFDLVQSRTPILIELKSDSLFSHKLEKLLSTQISNYSGQVAVQSFNPTSIIWFKNNFPRVPRGILSAKFTKSFNNRPTLIKRIILKSMILNKVIDPNFIAYNVLDLPSKKIEEYKKCGKTIIGWTVKSQEQYDQIKNYVDNIIFDNFIPKK